MRYYSQRMIASKSALMSTQLIFYSFSQNLASQNPKEKFFEAMNATYVEKMARFQQTKYTFQLVTEFEPTEPELEALSQKLVDQCYETYYEEEMITCKLVSSQDSFFSFIDLW